MKYNVTKLDKKKSVKTMLKLLMYKGNIMKKLPLIILCMFASIVIAPLHADVQEKNGICINTIGFPNCNTEILSLGKGKSLTVQDMVDQNTYPIILTIKNTSNKAVMLVPNSTCIDLANKKDLMSKLHHRIILKPLLCFFAANCTNVFLENLFNNYEGYMLRGWIILVGAPTYGWYLHNINKEIDKALNMCLLEDHVIIMPGQSVKKLFAFNHKPSNLFKLNLFDLSGQIIESFDISLN